MKTKIIILLASAFMGIGLATPHEKTIEFKIAKLCNDHPDKECQELDNYCRESLEKGFECYTQ
jgi:hypothetical protein